MMKRKGGSSVRVQPSGGLQAQGLPAWLGILAMLLRVTLERIIKVTGLSVLPGTCGRCEKGCACSSVL